MPFVCLFTDEAVSPFFFSFVAVLRGAARGRRSIRWAGNHWHGTVLSYDVMLVLYCAVL
jgi:hypothetical protein